MKFYSEPIAEHEEVPTADEGRLEDLIHNWEQRENLPGRHISESNNCYVVSLLQGEGHSGQLAEIMSLVRTQGDHIVGHETVRLLKPNPRTLIGTGKSKEIAARATESGADLLVLDAELSPSQMRNLEDTAGIAVCDREAVILNVFMKHARTRRAKVQVEIAHLEYLRPRIRGLGLDMDQQASSIVTGRGPGETASAMLARKLDGRLSELKKALSKIKKTATVQRAKRTSCKQVTLVGYTNAGKTSLMNALTNVKLSVRNRPFETLDTTTRSLSCHGGDVLLSDTVGFIRRLPDRLFASFESTLEGIKEASLLVLVADASDKEKELHLSATLKVLAKLGAEKIPVLYVFNKADLLDNEPSSEELSRLSQGHKFVCLSSYDRDAVGFLRDSILAEVRSEQYSTQLFVPYAASDVFSMIYAQCRVVSADAENDGLLFTLEGEPHVVTRIKARIDEVYNG
ncbi:MAG: GTPase HflX [Desulfobacteraceae bacterium]|nr:GTPase HflX [Desulfobacteraceae bacterium]